MMDKDVPVHEVFQKPLASEQEFQREVNRFPDLKTLQRNLDELMSVDKSGMSRQEIRDLFFRHAILQPFSYIAYEGNKLNLLTTFRARVGINERSEGVYSVKTFSYPTAQFCRQNGRANLMGKPVFYCSDQGGTAMIETKPALGDTIYLGKWGILCNREWRISCFLPPDIPSRNPWYNLAQNQFRHISKYAQQIGLGKAAHLELITNFLAKAFVEEVPPYHLTSWLADEVLYGYAGIDMMVYPSFTTSANTCNLAIRPDFADSYMKLQKVYRLLITGLSDTTINYQTQAVGNIVGDKIQWTAPTLEDEMSLPGKLTD